MEIELRTPQTLTTEINAGGMGNVWSVNGKVGNVVLDYEDVGALSDETVIPTKTSELTNDSGFLTEHQSLSGYATEQWVENKGYLTEHQSLTAYRTSANQDVIDATKQETLVSGTNIKTLNNQSILGSGNITIQADQEIYYATYGVTTFEDIQTAVANNKLVICINGSNKAVMQSSSNFKHYFICFNDTGDHLLELAYTCNRLTGWESTSYIGVPFPPFSGNYVLKSSDAEISWVAE